VTNAPTHPPMTTGFTFIAAPYSSGWPVSQDSACISGGNPRLIVTVPSAFATAGSTGIGCMNNPIVVTTIVATRPASGPLAPMSNSAFRSGIRPFMRMTAPIVPMRLGNGMKYGRLAFTRWYRLAT